MRKEVNTPERSRASLDRALRGGPQGQSQGSPKNVLWDLAEPHIRGAGLELIELDFGREAGGWVLRVYIERLAREGALAATGDEGDAYVSFEDCERVSRDLSAALDVADLIPYPYRLEVSSPGIDRPLRRERDFHRFAGAKVKVRTLEAVEGRRNFSGTILGVHGGLVDVECDGQSYHVPIDAIARAQLVPDWDAEFRRNKAHRSAL